MKRIMLIGLIVFFAIVQNYGQQVPVLFIQHPTVSPDGKWVAFEYKSNIYKVASEGGNATQLTTNNAYNSYPVWSHDGKKLAFASNRYGNFDVFIMPSDGGTAKRLTFNSAKDIPYDFSPDDQTVFFGTGRVDVPASVRFPAATYLTKLFSVPVSGGRSLMINSAGTDHVRYDSTGQHFLFQDQKSVEDIYRKHHHSPVTRDIWVYHHQTGEYKKLTNFDGEDTEPIWGAGKDFYYLSERSGTMNLSKSTTDQPDHVTQLTTFTKDPVRNLSRATDGSLLFTQDGQLYHLKQGDIPRKIDIYISQDFNDNQITTTALNGAATEMAVSPNGKEVAYACRGEIFVTATDGSGTRRITNSACEEKMIQYSADGRSILYSAELNGSWNIYSATISHKNEPYFYASTSVTISPVIATDKDEFQGVYSPDGKMIAYLEERNTLKVFNIASKSVKTLSPAGLDFSSVDGDMYFQWSPDSKQLLLSSTEGFFRRDNVILLTADGSQKPIRITQSGFGTSTPQWGNQGKLIYYLSYKNGLKPLTQGPLAADVYATFLNDELFYKTGKSKAELTLRDEMMRRDSAAGIVHPLQQKADLLTSDKLSQTYLEDRTRRLTSNSVQISDFTLSLDGEKLYYLARLDGGYNLWVKDTYADNAKLLTELKANSVGMVLSKDGKSLFIIADGKLSKVNPETGNKTDIPTNSSMSINAAEERKYIFKHTYAIIQKKFFDPKLQGTDWKYYYDRYERFLPHVNNNYDFEVLLSEFLGELNSSHTGSRYNAILPNSERTAAMGLLYDLEINTSGLHVKEVIKGGPFDSFTTHMKAGCVIDKIDGILLTKETDWAVLLNNKADQYIRVTFHDTKHNVFEEVIKPINQYSETSDLLYKRWLRKMESITDSLSHGTVGYIHIRLMDDVSFRNTIDHLDGNMRDKKAVILDTRFNTGGNLHEQLSSLLEEKARITYRPQGNVVPVDRLKNGSRKPTCVLMSEANFSDAYNFPYEYKRLGLGKLIGTSIAGTGTGVYWQEQLDKSLIIGIPMLGLSWFGETDFFENKQLDPDIAMDNSYDKILSGSDQQLEAAVKEMLRVVSQE